MFSIDGVAYTICRYVYHFALMSILFLIVCIPVVTIPAGIAALSGVSRAMIRSHPGSIWSAFWTLFKENFVQSLLCGWTLAAVAGFLVVDYSLSGHVKGFLQIPIFLALWFMTLVWVSVALHVFPLMVHMKTTYRGLFISALKLSLYRVHLTVIQLAAISVAAIISFHFPLTLFILLPGVTAYLTYWFVNLKFLSLVDQQNLVQLASASPDSIFHKKDS